jgi:hypothetical protein
MGLRASFLVPMFYMVRSISRLWVCMRCSESSAGWRLHLVVKREQTDLVQVKGWPARYEYRSTEPRCPRVVAAPLVLWLCRQVGARKVLDVGCANWALVRALRAAFFDAAGCDA